MRRLLAPLQDFLRLEAAGGLLLLIGTLLAMVAANSPLAQSYQALLDHSITLGWGRLRLTEPLLLWINDGFMAVFFLLVGLELKREMLEGHLASWQRAALPAFAAAGGMLFPALLYVAVNRA